MIFVSNQSVDPVDDPPEIRPRGMHRDGSSWLPKSSAVSHLRAEKKTRAIPTGDILLELAMYDMIMAMYYDYDYDVLYKLYHNLWL